jgi:hypothetical protein
MIEALFLLFSFSKSRFRNRTELALENLALRQQLAMSYFCSSPGIPTSPSTRSKRQNSISMMLRNLLWENEQPLPILVYAA